MADWLIHLRPSPTCKVPDAIALRKLLKVLLRTFGLVAIDVREVAGHAAAAGDRADAGEVDLSSNRNSRSVGMKDLPATPPQDGPGGGQGPARLSLGCVDVKEIEQPAVAGRQEHKS